MYECAAKKLWEKIVGKQKKDKKPTHIKTIKKVVISDHKDERIEWCWICHSEAKMYFTMINLCQIGCTKCTNQQPSLFISRKYCLESWNNQAKAFEPAPFSKPAASPYNRYFRHCREARGRA